MEHSTHITRPDDEERWLRYRCAPPVTGWFILPFAKTPKHPNDDSKKKQKTHF